VVRFSEADVQRITELSARAAAAQQQWAPILEELHKKYGPVVEHAKRVAEEMNQMRERVQLQFLPIQERMLELQAWLSPFIDQLQPQVGSELRKSPENVKWDRELVPTSEQDAHLALQALTPLSSPEISDIADAELQHLRKDAPIDEHWLENAVAAIIDALPEDDRPVDAIIVVTAILIAFVLGDSEGWHFALMWLFDIYLMYWLLYRSRRLSNSD
jgi:hypothetical protein